MDEPKRIMLPEVKVQAPKVPVKKYKEVKGKVKLYPKGMVDKSTIDSLTKAGRGGLIGNPMKMDGKMAEYGEAASDRIKQLIKKK